jgi:ribonuclease T
MNSPFHSFTSFDTATLGGLIYGETVLVKICRAAGIAFNVNEAHSALYDAQKTTELFCKIINDYDGYAS